MKPVYLILLVGMNLLWAGTYSVFKVLGEHLSSGAIVTLRYSLAAVFLLALWPWLPGRAPQRRDWLRVGLMGFCVFCLAPRLQVAGVHLGQAGDTSLLLALDPLITALAAAIFLREHIVARRWWGFALGMMGVVLLSNVWRGAQPLRGLLANVMVITCFAFETTYSIVGKPLLEHIGALKLLGGALVAGSACNLLMDALQGAPTVAAVRAMPLSAWWLMLYLVILCTVVGYALWYVVIKETEVNVTGLTIFVQPVAGFVISLIWLHESMHWGQFWGSLVIVAGLVVGLRRNGQRTGPGLAAAKESL